MPARLPVVNSVFGDIAQAVADQDRLQCSVDEANDEGSIRMDFQHLMPDLLAIFRQRR